MGVPGKTHGYQTSDIDVQVGVAGTRHTILLLLRESAMKLVREVYGMYYPRTSERSGSYFTIALKPWVYQAYVASLGSLGSRVVALDVEPNPPFPQTIIVLVGRK